MENAMIIITPKDFDLVVVLIIFGIGLDYSWSGICLLKNNKITRIPKLFSYFLIKSSRWNINKWENRNILTRSWAKMISLKAFGIYMCIGGPFLILISIKYLFLLSQ
jgi:hypothetical protein